MRELVKAWTAFVGICVAWSALCGVLALPPPVALLGGMIVGSLAVLPAMRLTIERKVDKAAREARRS